MQKSGASARKTSTMGEDSTTTRADKAATSSNAAPASGNGGLREEDVMAEDVAVMAFCENDETWQTLRRMRLQTRSKFLTCVCVIVQEVLGDPSLANRFCNWARRWGKDETDACVLHKYLPTVLYSHFGMPGAPSCVNLMV